LQFQPDFTLIGTGNETECMATVQSMFNLSIPCATPPCTFNGTYQPPVYGDFYVSICSLFDVI